MNNSKLTMIILAVVGVGVLGYLVFALTGSDSTDEVKQLQSVKLTDLEQHATVNDCWTLVNDKVYDITDYIPGHPGGDEILRACGNDGTSLFEQRTTVTGDQVGSGTPHSSSATNQLEGFLIGELVN